jgi:glucose-6-phosphate 1-dehydrogenase
VVIEKPFGSDLISARALNEEIHHNLNESQIFRIDHYLGKETVQNLLVFRFANSVFEPLWNRNHIDHVQITVAEEVGVEHRAGYYDGVGVLRDMFQNHLMQLLTLIALEPPATYKADAQRDEKVKVLRSIRPIIPEEVKLSTVRGQYRGYLNEPGVAPDSPTATYGAVRFYIDNWRWQDVPFYLRSGKNLAEKCTEIIIQFKCPPRRMFPLPQEYEMTANILALSLQPDEGIHLRFEAKVPDSAAEMQLVEMNFHYQDTFGPASIPEAYERLLMDALNGDPSLFIRADQAELAWELIDPIVAAWESPDSPPLASYEPGSFGPPEADQFLAREGRRWLRSCGNH